MKTETKTFILFFAVIAMGIMLLCHFTPTVKPLQQFEVIQTDTGAYNHSEIQVQELSESEMYYRAIEPHYEPLKLVGKGTISATLFK